MMLYFSGELLFLTVGDNNFPVFMKKYFTPLCILASSLLFASCDKNYDCACTSRSTHSSYIESIRAKNKDEGRKECLDLMDRTNAASYPGIDCDLN